MCIQCREAGKLLLTWCSAVWRFVSIIFPGAHFYCESLDITRPFPSDRPVNEPSWPFVWNKALSSPFRLAGLDGPNAVVPALLQVRIGRA